MFDGIDIHQAIPVIRAFTHFALLANVAEDIHRERRRAVHVAAGEPPQDSSLAATYLKLDSADLDSATVADALTGALVSPVITAHPTETRRRTVFDTQHRITELMRLRMHGHTHTADGRDIEHRAAPPHPDAVADRADPVVPVEDSGRDRNRTAVLPGGVPRGDPAGQRRGARSAAGPLAGGEPAGASRFCGQGRGSAATATAIRTSPPTSSGWPPHAPPTPRSRTTSARSPRWRRNCRCRRGWSRSATSWRRWPTRATSPRAPTNRTGARCGSSTAG